jgi:hypothetical protein
MNGVVWTIFGDDRVTASQDPWPADGLPERPTTVRTFHPGDDVSAQAEVYGPPGVVDLESRIEAVGGGVVVTRDETVEIRDGRAGYVVSMPIFDLPPGAYVLSLHARTSAAAVVREIPFTVED